MSFRAKCHSTQCKKTWFESKIMGPPVRQRPKAHILKHADMVEKEEMDCFKMVNNES